MEYTDDVLDLYQDIISSADIVEAQANLNKKAPGHFVNLNDDGSWDIRGPNYNFTVDYMGNPLYDYVNNIADMWKEFKEAFDRVCNPDQPWVIKKDTTPKGVLRVE
jgi:hypothetical protein